MCEELKMVLSSELIKEIESDISRCKAHTELNGSEALYCELVAKYSIVDPDFANNLSISGKVAGIGCEFDYRMELRAIEAKLTMILLTASNSKEVNSYNIIDDLIIRADKIKKCEYHKAANGFPFSYVAGPLFDEWMNDINLINKTQLKDHPLSDDIQNIFTDYNKNYSSFDDMLALLKVLQKDRGLFDQKGNNMAVNSLEAMLNDDIERCQECLNKKADLATAKKIYKDITARYDNIIDGLGNGLYCYYQEGHFYMSDLDEDSLLHNINVIMQKIILHRAMNCGTITTELNSTVQQSSNKVFIVHGHDCEAKITVARVLEKASFEAIILHEQANSGQTIIEKIEKHTDVSYAVVLYTECDRGRAKEESVELERNRARQNVVFEHGYLIGKLSRERVSAIVKGNVETPGDISGVVYTPMDDAGAWKMELFKEMKAAGLNVDLNKALI